MKVHIGADWHGYERARVLENWLAEQGHEVVWHAAEQFDQGDDYVLFAVRVAEEVLKSEDLAEEVKGIVVGADGNGEVIAANKVNGARAIGGYSIPQVIAGRTLNNASVLVIPVDYADVEASKQMVTAFFETSFDYTVDSARRIINTNEYENSGTIEGWAAADFPAPHEYHPADAVGSTGPFSHGSANVHH
jgi:ribose 5-phosphate isomerase B